MSDLSPETRTLIETLRDADRPTAADRARNRGELASRLGIGVVAAGAVAAGAKTAAAGTAAASIGAAGGTKVGLGAGGLTLTMKLAGAAVVASGVAVSAVAVQESRQPEPVVAPLVAPHVAKAAPRVAPRLKPVRSARIVEELAPESDEAASALPEAIEVPPAALPTASPLELAAPKGDVVKPPTSARVEAAARNAAPSPENATAAPSLGASNRAEAPREDRTTTPPTLADTTLAAETSLLVRAQEALVSGDPETALALLHQHARRFPTGVLAEERDATRVAAMCAAGQTERARTEAARFVAAHPGSPMAARVRRTCEVR